MIFTPQNDKANILKNLKLFKEYIQGDINNMNDMKTKCGNRHFKEIEDEIIEIAKLLEKKERDSLTVYGEVMLACEKIIGRLYR